METVDAVSGKAWLTIGDEDVRDDHSVVEGVVVGKTSDFELPGGYLAAYPGDWRLPRELRINCRCTIVSAVFGERPAQEPAQDVPDLFEDA